MKWEMRDAAAASIGLCIGACITSFFANFNIVGLIMGLMTVGFIFAWARIRHV